MNEIRRLAELLCQEEVAVPAFTDFVEHGYQMHEGCGWRDFHILRYHSFLISLSYNLENVVNISYGESFAVIKKNTTDYGKKKQNRM